MPLVTELFRWMQWPFKWNCNLSHSSFVGFHGWNMLCFPLAGNPRYKNTYLCALSVWHRFTYLTAHFAAVSKRNAHWVALKHRLNTWTLAHFYYVDIGTYCCVFITLLQIRIAAVQNSNIRGLSLRVYALSCCSAKQMHKITNAKLIYKRIFSCNCAILTSLYADLNCFVEPW